MRISDWSSDVCSSDLVLTHFLLLMRDVPAFASLTHAIALDGLGKDHRRRTLMLARRRVGRVDLVWIVTPAIQPRNVFIRSDESRVGKECVRTRRARMSRNR